MQVSHCRSDLGGPNWDRLFAIFMAMGRSIKICLQIRDVHDFGYGHSMHEMDINTNKCGVYRVGSAKGRRGNLKIKMEKEALLLT